MWPIIVHVLRNHPGSAWCAELAQRLDERLVGLENILRAELCRGEPLQGLGIERAGLTREAFHDPEREFHIALLVRVGEAHERARSHQVDPELLTHAYQERDVELSLWIVERFAGEPRSLDGQVLKWLAPAALGLEDILEADQPFIEALRELSTPG